LLPMVVLDPPPGSKHLRRWGKCVLRSGPMEGIISGISARSDKYRSVKYAPKEQSSPALSRLRSQRAATGFVGHRGARRGGGGAAALSRPAPPGRALAGGAARDPRRRHRHAEYRPRAVPGVPEPPHALRSQRPRIRERGAPGGAARSGIQRRGAADAIGKPERFC